MARPFLVVAVDINMRVLYGIPVFKIGCWQCCLHEKWIKLFCIEVLETNPYFNIECSVRAGKQQFQ